MTSGLPDVLNIISVSRQLDNCGDVIVLQEIIYSRITKFFIFFAIFVK